MALRPTALIVRIPIKEFSKNDDPKRIAKVLNDFVKTALKQLGPRPFDWQRIKTELVFDGSERDTSKA